MHECAQRQPKLGRGGRLHPPSEKWAGAKYSQATQNLLLEGAQHKERANLTLIESVEMDLKSTRHRCTRPAGDKTEREKNTSSYLSYQSGLATTWGRKDASDRRLHGAPAAAVTHAFTGIPYTGVEWIIIEENYCACGTGIIENWRKVAH